MEALLVSTGVVALAEIGDKTQLLALVLPTGRVRAPTWVADGAVLIGDAAHAMNPHASQGRMQAMVDAMALADLLQNVSR